MNSDEICKDLSLTINSIGIVGQLSALLLELGLGDEEGRIAECGEILLEDLDVQRYDYVTAHMGRTISDRKLAGRRKDSQLDDLMLAGADLEWEESLLLGSDERIGGMDHSDDIHHRFVG